jgi:hypothetical protein
LAAAEFAEAQLELLRIRAVRREINGKIDLDLCDMQELRRLADPGLILEPDFDRLAFGAVGELRCDGRGEVFLNVCWASSSAWGWRGLTDSLR